MRKRRIKKRKNNQKRRIIFFSLITLLLLLSVGYASFSSNVSLTVKGNVKYKDVNYLKKNVVTTVDGLYNDPITQNRYVYRGSNPNNYILINTELFRIVAIEQDNVLKVVSDESIGTHQYDDESRYSSNSDDYCHLPNKGCNIWGSKTTMLDSSSNHIDKIIGLDSSYYNLPEKEAYINSIY